MTAPGTITEAPMTAGSGVTAAASPLPLWRRVRRFGTGFGIAIANDDLETVIVRSRPSGSSVVASALIRNFASRPAAEWGAELLGFLRAAGEPHLAATLVLPREEVIVRTVRLPGVAQKDTASAIELQLDTLHPWDDTPIEWAWSRVTATDIVVGIVRQTTLGEYETLFSEAGIPIAAATFSSAVIHAALRLQQTAPASIFCFTALAPGRLEVYGESDARPCYSAGFTLSPERALAVARAELRLSPEHPAVDLSLALFVKSSVPSSSPSSAPIAYAAALAASAPLLGNFANLLPAERRASHSRTRYLIPIALAALLVVGAIAVFVIFPIVNERRYVADLTAEQRRIAPAALRVQTIDKTLATDRARIAALDDFRQRPQADLDVLNELVRLLPEQVWTSSIEISPDTVVIAGEADQAAPLLKLLNSSTLFEKSEFAMPVTHNGQTDLFRIRTMRRGRAGRTTP